MHPKTAQKPPKTPGNVTPNCVPPRGVACGAGGAACGADKRRASEGPFPKRIIITRRRHDQDMEPSSENRGQERSTRETAWRRHLSVRSANAVSMSYEGSGTYGEFLKTLRQQADPAPRCWRVKPDRVPSSVKTASLDRQRRQGCFI